MKKSYIKLLIFEFILLIIFFLNSFVWNILSNYYLVLFLLINIILFKILFGIEKDRHRYIKDIIYEIIIFLLIFFLGYYILGIIIGFYQSQNYFTWAGFTNFIIPTIATIILREYFRYEVVTKAEGNRLLIIITYFMFLMLDLTNVIYYQQFTSSYDIFIFIALSLLPIISNNILGMYLVRKVGYKPNIVYFLTMKLYPYLLPIIPNPNEYLKSIIDFLLPIVLLYRCSLFFYSVNDADIDREYNRKKLSVFVFPAIITTTLVYFTSGYFHYHAIAIASGSMEPGISKGDVVIIEKIDGDYDKLEKGQIIAYSYNDIVVVHRLIRIIEDNGVYYFYSKGDANSSEDNYVINEEMIIGIVNIKIPYIGLPTVWLNEL